MLEYKQEKQFPYSSSTWSSSERLKHTQLSRILYDRNVVASHRHRWLVMIGYGNGIYCAIGARIAAFNNPDIVLFARSLIVYTDRKVTQKWIARILNPDLSWTVASPIWENPIPEDGFKNEGEFEIWWDKTISPLERAFKEDEFLKELDSMGT